MVNEKHAPRELSGLVVPPSGALKTTGDPFDSYRLVDGAGETIRPTAAFFAELVACGRRARTLRSYGMDLSRWFRFLSALGLAWDQATRVEARDFCSWLQLALKPVRPHWRYPDGGGRYAAVTIAHCESVLRGFYDFHVQAGTGPMLNPFPLARARGGARARAYHNPMEPFSGQRRGRYRPTVVAQPPRAIPDDQFARLFTQLGLHRDLVTFWVSTGARASELLGATVADVDPGQQLITVLRKGTGALQPLPAALGAFIWLRLYQTQV